MRARAVVGAMFASGFILFAGWESGAGHNAALPTASAPKPAAGAKSSASPTPSATIPAPVETSTTTPTPTPTTAAPSPTPPPTPAPTAAAPKPAPPPPAPAPAAPPPPAISGTFQGALVQTAYGTVRVAVTIAGGRITDVAALKLTDAGSTSVQISAYAAPILRSEVLASQSANVRVVSGATYTSDGYLGSLQSALASAHFG